MFLLSLQGTTLGRIETKIDKMYAQMLQDDIANACESSTSSPSVTMSAFSHLEDNPDNVWAYLKAELLGEQISMAQLTAHKDEIFRYVKSLVQGSLTDDEEIDEDDGPHQGTRRKPIAARARKPTLLVTPPCLDVNNISIDKEDAPSVDIGLLKGSNDCLPTKLRSLLHYSLNEEKYTWGGWIFARFETSRKRQICFLTVTIPEPTKPQTFKESVSSVIVYGEGDAQRRESKSMFRNSEPKLRLQKHYNRIMEAATALYTDGNFRTSTYEINHCGSPFEISVWIKAEMKSETAVRLKGREPGRGKCIFRMPVCRCNLARIKGQKDIFIAPVCFPVNFLNDIPPETLLERLRLRRSADGKKKYKFIRD